MKPKLRWLLLILPLALFAWAYQAAAWRPKLVGEQLTFVPQNGYAMLPSDFSGPQILISPDSKYLISLAELRTGYLLTMWAPQKKRQLWQYGELTKRVFPLAFSPDSRILAVVSVKTFSGKLDSTDIVLLETATGKSRTLPYASWQDDLQSAAFVSPRELVVSTSQNTFFIVDTQTRKVIRGWKFKLPTFLVRGQQQPSQSHVSADGKTVIALKTGLNQTAVILYNTATGKLRATWNYPYIARNPRLSPDGTLWAMELEKSDVPDFYDAKTGKELWSPSYIVEARSPWVWGADSQRVAVTMGSDTWIFGARKGQYLMNELGRNSTGQALALDPRGDVLYTLDKTGKIWRWRAR